jgi:L-amino acid N-acyltransferase YncA
VEPAVKSALWVILDRENGVGYASPAPITPRETVRKTVEAKLSVNLDYDADGKLVGIELLDADFVSQLAQVL